MSDAEKREEERRYAERAEIDGSFLNDPLRVLNPTPAAVIGTDSTVADAVAAMQQRRCGCALVVEDGAVTGIFTERDLLLRVVAAGAPPDATKITEVMTNGPECLTLEDTIGFALHKMSVGAYRHLPVVDETGQPIGIVTQQSGVRYLAGFFPIDVINQPPKSYQQKPPRNQYGG